MKKPNTGAMAAKRWIMHWFCLGFLLIFISNIVMHLGSCRCSDVDERCLPLLRQEYCELENDGRYVPVNSAPICLYYSTENISGDLSQICINFDKPLDTYVYLNVYCQDEDGSYPLIPLGGAITERLVPGLESHVVDLKSTDCHEIKIEFDQPVYISNICSGNRSLGKMMIYADTGLRYRVWGICLFISFCLSILFFTSRLYRKMWSGLCQRGRAFMFHCYHCTIVRRFMQILLIGLLMGVCMEVLAMISSSRKFNAQEALAFSVIVIVILIFYFFRDVYLKKQELIAVAVFVLLAVLFICVMPVNLGVSWDDDTHYYRMVSLARVPSGTITEADDAFIGNACELSGNAVAFQKDQREMNRQRYDEKYRDGRLIDNTVEFTYRDIPYLPFIAGIWAAYGLGLPFCAMALCAKFFQLFLFAMLFYASLKNVNSGKLLILAFAMIPTVLFEVCSYTYDTWLNFFMIYAFSRYVGELQRKEEKLTFLKFCMIFVPAFLGLLPKIVYAPMLFLMLYMPKSKWDKGKKRGRIAYYSCFLAAALVFVSVICYVASGRMNMGSGDIRGSAESDGNMQLQFILHHFKTYCHTLLVFLQKYLSYGSSSEYLMSFSAMGILHIQYLSISLLLATAFWDRSSVDKKTVPFITKIAAVIMPVMIAVICATVMYISFTAVGLDQIKGCQGRYLLPAIFPVLFLFSRSGHCLVVHQKIPIEIGNMVLIFFMVCYALIPMWALCILSY